MARKLSSISLLRLDVISLKQIFRSISLLSICLKCLRSKHLMELRRKRAACAREDLFLMMEEGCRRSELLDVSGERLLEGGEEVLSGDCLLNFSIWFCANFVIGMSSGLSISKYLIQAVFEIGSTYPLKLMLLDLPNTLLDKRVVKTVDYNRSTMLRKNIRQRRQYLFGLSKQRENKEKSSKLQIIRDSLQGDTHIPTQLYKEKDQLQQQLKKHNASTIVARSRMDDEYANTIYSDPQILITTSRDPTNRLLQFAKQLSILLPNTSRINRGGTVMAELVELGLRKGVTDLVLLHQHRGQPDGLIISHLPVGPTLYFGMQNVVLRHDVKQKVQNMPEIYPHLIFHNFNTQLGQRVKTVLQHLFPVAKPDSKRIITFANNNDVISFRHHKYEKESYKEVGLIQLGPRFQLKLYQISLGLVTQPEASKEWVLRPYMNTATKRHAL